MNVKKILMYAVIGLLLFWLIADPTGAADTLSSGLRTLQEIAQAIVTFLKTLFG